MSEQNEIPIEVKRQILQNELAIYRNTNYLLTIRHRVNKKLGNTAEQLKTIEDDLAKNEMAIEEIEKVIKELEKP